jgi:4'-phosphopantetheinyl transferase EntD
MGKQQEPVWPERIIGSITHCDKYCAAVVASRITAASIGIDAEPNAPLPEGVLDLIALAAEKEWIKKAPAGSISWDRLVFSIKESIYKAWFPLTSSWLDFSNALVEIEPLTRTFKAEISRQRAACQLLRGLNGRYIATDTLLATFVSVPSCYRPPHR